MEPRPAGRRLSYLLRLWQAEGERDLTWRATLEQVGTGERRGFPSLEALFAYLREQAQGQALSSGEERREANGCRSRHRQAAAKRGGQTMKGDYHEGHMANGWGVVGRAGAGRSAGGRR